MNTEKFKKELSALISKFNKSQGAYLLDIDLYSSLTTSNLGKKDIEYRIEIKLG